MVGKKNPNAVGGNPRKRLSPGVPIPTGTILKGVSYVSKTGSWRLGTSIGVGGFGVIFTASTDIDRVVPCDAPLVAKIEPYDNGPLFTEFHAMQRLSRPEYILEWKKQQQLNFLGVPPLVGFGTVVFKDVKYRFIIMERYGEDIHKLFQDSGRHLPTQTVCNIALKVIDVLQYMHARNHTHNDIKGANLLIGYGPKKRDDVYLIDFGLARLYTVQGKHMEYRVDRRFAHNGTREFTCRDAHMGVTSRRGDLETLGYCLLLWEVGHLPWEAEPDDNKVHAEKNAAFKNTSAFLKKLFGGKKSRAVPKYLDEYFKLLGSTEFDAEPDYTKFKAVLRGGLLEAGVSDKDGKLVFPCKIGCAVANGDAKQRRRASNEENIDTDEAPKKRGKKPAPEKKRYRRSISTSPRIPLRHKQRNLSPVKSGASSSSTSTDDLRNVGLTPAALDMIKRHPHLKERLVGKNKNFSTASVPPNLSTEGHKEAESFRRDSDMIEMRIQAGVHHHPRVNSDAARDSNTIAGCSPSPRRKIARQRNPRLFSESESNSHSMWSDSDDGEDDIDVSDLEKPNSHMMAVLSKNSTDGSTSGRSNSNRKAGKTKSKLDLAECSSIPTPAMLEFMQSHPEMNFKYAASSGKEASGSKMKPKVPGVRSSPRLRARK